MRRYDLCAPVPAPGTHGRNLSTRSPCFGQTSLAVWRLGHKAFRVEGFRRRKACSPPDAGDIGLSKGPPMQSTPTLKDTDPHDVFAIETLLHAHAEKAPPLAHDTAAPPAAPQVHVTPISAGAPISQVEPTFRASDVRDIQIENIRPSEIKVDGLKPPGERPMAKWAKRVIMALLGLCGATAAAAWQHYGDQAKAVAAEWAPPFVLAALSSDKAAVAEQPNASAVQAAAVDPTAAQPAATTPAQPEPAAAPA